METLVRGFFPMIYYMRDNHTFRRLTPRLEDALSQALEEFDAGFRHGMLCASNTHPLKEVVHASGDRSKLITEGRKWLTKALSA